MDDKLKENQNPGKPAWRKVLIIFIIMVAVASAITTALILNKMGDFNKILKSQSGYYLLHLALAYTKDQANAVVPALQKSLPIALESIWWDWFLILSYVIFLTAFYYLFTWKFKEAFKKTWTLFLFFPLAAGIFDVIENIFMLSWLKSSTPPGGFAVFLGSLSATVKFLLLISTILAIINSWFIRKGGEIVTLDEVLAEELKIIKKRREAADGKNNTNKPVDLFGIALSGGGIRSATLNAGILDIFNQVGIFSKTDYLSTVSGGGYIGGYVQAKLWRKQDKSNPYDTLFEDNDISHLEANGEYLIPGKKIITRFFSYLRVGGAFVFSMIMNFTWFLSLLLALFILVQMILGPLFKIELVKKILWGTTALVFAYHFLPFRRFRFVKYPLWSSNVLNIIEGVLLLPIIVYFISIMFPGFNEQVVPAVNEFILGNNKSPFEELIKKVPLIPVFLITLLILFISAISYNPNVLSLHRFFRDRLSKTYLETNPEGEECRHLKLTDLNSNRTGAKGKREWKAPYPLINTCLNLLGEGGNGKKGLNFLAKSSDFFLLSPLYCGSYRTGYVKTSSPVYRHMTLSTAISISGAAINPNMGVHTNRFIAFFMSLLNLKTGYWALNPRESKCHFYYTIWPYYLLKELLCKTNTNRWKVNISDGGHLENLAVFELLRRKCRLIIAVDAGADPGFDFGDLKNLVIRARNELGIAIKFRREQDPESIIKPKPSTGYSKEHFVIADVEELPLGKNQGNKNIGVLIYLKSSLKAPQTKLTNKDQLKSKSKSYHYKTSHPDFPHESTVDQFFDEAQWEAYYNLGRYMAGDLLKIDDIEDECLISLTKLQLEKMDINGLIKYIEERCQCRQGKFSIRRFSIRHLFHQIRAFIKGK